MSRFHIAGLPDAVTDEVRRTRRSPGYGHPAVAELARGTGPCRSCLSLFEVGVDERLLFTYGPPSGGATVAAPGPVFIHAHRCTRYDAVAFPDGLRDLPLLIEARTSDGRVLQSVRTEGKDVDGIVNTLLTDQAAEFLFVRHGEAGCHIVRVDRG